MGIWSTFWKYEFIHGTLISNRKYNPETSGKIKYAQKARQVWINSDNDLKDN